MPSPHTAENIRKFFDDEVEHLNVRFYCLVTDNAANMKKAFNVRLLPEKQATLSLANSTDEDTDEETLSQSEDESSTELNSEDIFTTSLRCAAHTMQLVVHDGLRAIACDKVDTALTKVKNIARFAAKSSSFSELLQGHQPPQANATRWDSEFRLLQHILSKTELIHQALIKESKKQLILSNMELDILREIASRLSYFAEATDLLQAENKPTISVVIPVLISLERALRSFSINAPILLTTTFSSDVGNQLGTVLLNSLCERFEFARTTTNPLYITAAVLDPSVKLSFASSIEDRSNNFSFLHEECKFAAYSLLQKITPRELAEPNPASNVASYSQSNVLADDAVTTPKRRLLDFFSDATTVSTAPPLSLRTAFDEYLSTPTQSAPNALLFWKKSDSILRSAALEILSVPASSAPVERMFSRAGRILSPLRSKLSHSRLSDLMSLTVNGDDD